MKREIEDLRARLDQCCGTLDAQDEVVVSTGKRQDRLEARLRQVRSDLRVRLEVLRLRVDELETVQNRHDERLRLVEALVGQGESQS